MAKIDKEYHKLLREILEKGFKYEDPNRKGVYRIQIPDYKFEHSFEDGFPALTTKKVYFKGAIGELLTFLSGSCELKDLHKNKVKFWDKDAYNYYLKNTGFEKNENSLESFKYGIDKRNHKAGDLGKVYPYQMRSFGENNVDQIVDLINTLKNNPMVTKKTVTMWNPSDVREQCLSPCHFMFQILTEPISPLEILEKSDKSTVPYSYDGPEYQFTLKFSMHSVDTFLGLPINIMYYSLLAEIIGKMVNMKPKGIIGDLSNVHIYEPHLDAVREQLSRDVDKFDKCELNIDYDIEMGLRLPSLLHAFDKTLSQIEIKDFTLVSYNSYPPIKAEMLAYNK